LKSATNDEFIAVQVVMYYTDEIAGMIIDDISGKKG